METTELFDFGKRTPGENYCFLNEHFNVLAEPYTKEQICKLRNDDGCIDGVIKLSLGQVIDNDLEGFLDIISELLVGYELLNDIYYKVVGIASDGSLLIHVSGLIETVGLDEDEEEEEKAV